MNDRAKFCLFCAGALIVGAGEAWGWFAALAAFGLAGLLVAGRDETAALSNLVLRLNREMRG